MDGKALWKVAISRHKVLMVSTWFGLQQTGLLCAIANWVTPGRSRGFVSRQARRRLRTYPNRLVQCWCNLEDPDQLLGDSRFAERAPAVPQVVKKPSATLGVPSRLRCYRTRPDQLVAGQPGWSPATWRSHLGLFTASPRRSLHRDPKLAQLEDRLDVRWRD